MQRLMAKNNLAIILEHQGRSLSWLARMLDVSPSMASLIVSGRRTVTLDRALLIGDMMGVPIDFLFVVKGEGK
jgi:plasmid maintenance system antidote protein VapI